MQLPASASGAELQLAQLWLEATLIEATGGAKDVPKVGATVELVDSANVTGLSLISKLTPPTLQWDESIVQYVNPRSILYWSEQLEPIVRSIFGRQLDWVIIASADVIDM